MSNLNEGFSETQTKALAAKLSAKHIRTRTKNGFTMSYMEGWQVIFEANRIFGFDGWDRQTVDSQCLWKGNRTGRAAASYMARVRIQVRAGDQVIVREGTGAGHCEANDIGEAHENALKEAETDATKRALSTFGNSFGLALYDKEQRYVRKLPKKAPTKLKKGDVVWVVVSDGGVLSEYHDEPVAYCSAIRHHLENLNDWDQLQLFWEDNAATIEDMRDALPSLQTEAGQHYADVLASIYATRMQSIFDANNSAAQTKDPQDSNTDTSPEDLSNQATSDNSIDDKAADAENDAADNTVTPISSPRRLRDKSHLKFVASKPCLICDRTPCQAHHVRFAQPRAMGRKVSDEWTVPLCLTHHRSLHDAGNEVNWWATQKVEPLAIAEGLWNHFHQKQAAE